MSLKSFCKKNQDMIIGSSGLLLLYLVEAAIRPLSVPGEYNTIFWLRSVFPKFSGSMLWFRLFAVAATFAGAAAVFLLAKRWRFKRPGAVAAFYLLFPPVFYSGTAVGGNQILCGTVLAALCGLITAAGAKSVGRRALVIFPAVPWVLLAAFYVDSPVFRFSDFWLLSAPVVVLFISWRFNVLEQNRERAVLLLNRISFATTLLLALTAVLIWVPVLLRHFRVDFPEEVALYGRSERVIRPMLLLLLPLIWLYLAKESKKIGKKLLFLSAALGFFVLVLPITLPWQIQKNIYPEYAFVHFKKELPPGDTVAFAERSELPFFTETFDFPVKTVGDAPGDIAPGKIAENVYEQVKKSNVLVIIGKRELEKFCPLLAGKRYTIGKYFIFCYYKSGSKKTEMNKK